MTPTSRLKCSVERNKLIWTLEWLLSKNKSSYTLSKEMFKIKWSSVNSLERRPIKSMPEKDHKLMLLLIRWLTKITSWWESTKLSKNRANRIWSSQSMKRRHSSKDKQSLKNMRKRWSDDMLLNNKRDPTTFSKWRSRLKLREMLSSKSSPKRKLKEEPRLLMLRTSETIFRSKSWRRKPELPNTKKQKKEEDKKRSFKPPRTTSSNLRPRDSRKKREWKKISRLRWLRSSLKMKDLSRWTPKREEWEN